MNRISLTIYGKTLDIISSLKSIEGISYEHKPVDMAFDADIDLPKHIDLFITIASGVGINLFASWLYDKIKSGKKSDNKETSDVTLNGVKITVENVTINQIINIVNSQPD